MRGLVLSILLLCLASFAHAQYYDVSVVYYGNESLYSSLVYDDNSTSYKDNSLENADALLRICAMQASDLLGKYYTLAYADCFDGDYIELMHAPLQITSVDGAICSTVPLEISSFKAWYPSIPYVFISNTTDMTNAARWKLSRLRGWFNGSFDLNVSQAGSIVNITVVNSSDDMDVPMDPDVDFLVVGLVRDDYTCMDTDISSINDSVALTADSPSALYRIFINGIGPDTPPYVEIITPEPITYDSGIIPFTYIMLDDDDIVDCWYVLDGATVNMPVCGPAYILDVADGEHTLTLYGRDTTGNVGSDSVTFQVGTPPSPPGGGGPPGVPVYPTPHVPPPPPTVLLTTHPIEPQECIVIEYPLEGQKAFELSSTADLTDLQCFIRGDFGEYTWVDIGESIGEDETIMGMINVYMEPLEILNYNLSTVAALQCVAKSDPTLIASTVSDVCLVLYRPNLMLQNKSIELNPGLRTNVSLFLNNSGPYNATAINITVGVARYKSMVILGDYPESLSPGETAFMTVLVDSWDVDHGTYMVPIDVYEMGKFMTRGHLSINVKKPSLPVTICEIPDLTWTFLIFIVGLLLAMRTFSMKLKQEMLHAQRVRRRAGKYEKYRKPLLYALAIMAVAVILWVLVVWLLGSCD